MGTDAYATTQGWALITALQEPEAHSYNLADAVEIVFNFEPDDPEARDLYTQTAVGDHDQVLTVGAGARPSRRWAATMGFTIGSRHRCMRRDLRQGVGNPVVFEFPAIDDAAVTAAFEEGAL